MVDVAEKADACIDFKQIFEKLDPTERKTKVICTLG